MAASLLVGLLMNEDINASMQRVESLRNVQMAKAWISMGGDWMDKLINEPCTVHTESNCYLANTSRPTASVIHAGVPAQPGGGTRQPLCKWRRGATGRTVARSENQAVLKTPREARNFNSTFCRDCLSKLSSSRRSDVRKAFDITT